MNGLVCLYSRNGDSWDPLVLNITTREILYLPKPTTTKYDSFHIGFDHMTGDYKVLHIWYSAMSSTWKKKWEVCTIGSTDSCPWRKITDPPKIIRQGRGFSDPCVNGTMYWLSWGGGIYFLVAFDVGREVFRTLKFAEPITHVHYQLVFVLRGYLAVGVGGNPFEIWLLEEKNNNNSNQVLVKEKISFLTTPSLPFPPIQNGSNWGILPTGETFLLSPAQHSRTLYVIDLKEKRITKKRFHWSQPRKGGDDKQVGNVNDLYSEECYSHEENMYRFKNQDDVRHRHGSLLHSV
ncbi:OLC1v1025184C1 [Oldenlandia corymbosa var. corymbosa]|nr:OLC1v1025184C1 [Oldenlandia corymbosa var. corymbosa]